MGTSFPFSLSSAVLVRTALAFVRSQGFPQLPTQQFGNPEQLDREMLIVNQMTMLVNRASSRCVMPTGPKGEKRPMSVIENAVLVARIATGDVTEGAGRAALKKKSVPSTEKATAKD